MARVQFLEFQGNVYIILLVLKYRLIAPPLLASSNVDLLHIFVLFHRQALRFDVLLCEILVPADEPSELFFEFNCLLTVHIPVRLEPQVLVADNEANQGEYVVRAAGEAVVTHYSALIYLHQVIPEFPIADSMHRQVEYQYLTSLKQGHI